MLHSGHTVVPNSGLYVAVGWLDVSVFPFLL